jgi:hypothetical protein
MRGFVLGGEFDFGGQTPLLFRFTGLVNVATLVDNNQWSC